MRYGKDPKIVESLEIQWQNQLRRIFILMKLAMHVKLSYMIFEVLIVYRLAPIATNIHSMDITCTQLGEPSSVRKQVSPRKPNLTF